MLSHAAVRARNAGALMAACLSPQRFAELRAMAGSYVQLTPSQVLNPCALPDKGGCCDTAATRLQVGCRYGV